MVGFPIPGRAGQDFGTRQFRLEIGEKLAQELGRQDERINAVTPKRSLNSLVVHIVVGGNGTVIPEKTDPAVCRR
jgi:hypothetical protein